MSLHVVHALPRRQGEVQPVFPVMDGKGRQPFPRSEEVDAMTPPVLARWCGGRLPKADAGAAAREGHRPEGRRKRRRGRVRRRRSIELVARRASICQIVSCYTANRHA